MSTDAAQRELDEIQTVEGLVIEKVFSGGTRGATISEIRESIPQHHHGTLSGVLSMLHQREEIARLQNQRDRNKIYVMPAFVMGRVVEKQGRGPSPLETLVAYWMEPDTASTTGRTHQPRARKYPQRFIREIEETWRREYGDAS